MRRPERARDGLTELSFAFMGKREEVEAEEGDRDQVFGRRQAQASRPTRRRPIAVLDCLFRRRERRSGLRRAPEQNRVPRRTHLRNDPADRHRARPRHAALDASALRPAPGRTAPRRASGPNDAHARRSGGEPARQRCPGARQRDAPHGRALRRHPHPRRDCRRDGSEGLKKKSGSKWLPAIATSPRMRVFEA